MAEEMTPRKWSADRFLRRHFLLQERAASAKACSAEAVVRGTAAEAQASEIFRLWAIGVVGTVEKALGVKAIEVARLYYTGLTNAHFSIVARSGGHVASREVGQGESPDEAADLQSFCDWRAVARTVFDREDRAAQTACRGALMDVRQAIQLELDRREEEEETDDDAG